MSGTVTPLSEHDRALFHSMKAKRLRGAKAIKQFQRLGDQGVALLSAVLAHDDLKSQSWAIAMLGHIQIKSAIPILIAALTDENVGIQLDAARALAQYHEDALPGLFTALSTASVPQRKGVIQTLALIQSPFALPYLQAQLQHEDATIQVLAVDALGKLADSQAVESLLPYMHAEDGGVRLAVIETLGVLRATKAIPALLEAVDDPDWTICITSIEALAHIGDQQSMLRLIKHLSHLHPNVRAKIAEVCGRTNNSDVVPQLLPLLQDEAIADLGNPQPVNVAVALALGALGDHRSVEPLMQTLQHATHVDTRWAAAIALGLLGDSRAYVVLSQASAHDDAEVSWGGETVGEAAAHALVQLNGKPTQ